MCIIISLWSRLLYMTPLCCESVRSNCLKTLNSVRGIIRKLAVVLDMHFLSQAKCRRIRRRSYVLLASFISDNGDVNEKESLAVAFQRNNNYARTTHSLVTTSRQTAVLRKRPRIRRERSFTET